MTREEILDLIDAAKEFVGGLGLEDERAKASAAAINLHGAVLDGLDLSGIHFPKGSNFHGASCRGTKFSRAVLRHVNFAQANLEGAVLTGADCEGANFTEACLCRSVLFNTRFVLANLSCACASQTDGLEVLTEVISVDELGKRNITGSFRYEGGVLTTFGSSLKQANHDHLSLDVHRSADDHRALRATLPQKIQDRAREENLLAERKQAAQNEREAKAKEEVLRHNTKILERLRKEPPSDTRDAQIARIQKRIVAVQEQ